MDIPKRMRGTFSEVTKGNSKSASPSGPGMVLHTNMKPRICLFSVHSCSNYNQGSSLEYPSSQIDSSFAIILPFLKSSSDAQSSIYILLLQMDSFHKNCSSPQGTPCSCLVIYLSQAPSCTSCVAHEFTFLSKMYPCVDLVTIDDYNHSCLPTTSDAIPASNCHTTSSVQDLAIS